MDIQLDKNGDLYLTPQGDISFSDSVAQKIRIRLLWFAGEWRWNPDEGLPYFDHLFRKNPDMNLMESLVRTKIFEIPEVTEVREVRIVPDRKTRNAVICFEALTDQETVREEVEICLITA